MAALHLHHPACTRWTTSLSISPSLCTKDRYLQLVVCGTICPSKDDTYISLENDEHIMVFFKVLTVPSNAVSRLYVLKDAVLKDYIKTLRDMLRAERFYSSFDFFKEDINFNRGERLCKSKSFVDLQIRDGDTILIEVNCYFSSFRTVAARVCE